MDHLAEEKDASVGVGFQRSIGNVHGILDAEAETEVAGQNKPHWAEIKHRRQQIPLAWVLHLACLFDTRNHRTFVKNWNVKLPRHRTFYPLRRWCVAPLGVRGWIETKRHFAHVGQ